MSKYIDGELFLWIIGFVILAVALALSVDWMLDKIMKAMEDWMNNE